MGILGINSVSSSALGAIGSNYSNGKSQCHYIKITTPSNNITVDSATAYLKQMTSEPTITYKYVLFDAIGTFIRFSQEGTFYSTTRVWHSLNFATPKPVLLASSTYYLGILGKPEDNTVYVHGSTSPVNRYVSNSTPIDTNVHYVNGSNVVPSQDVSTSYNICLYLTYTDGGSAGGPALKLEGITPGKLEGTSWSSLATVR